ncbi:TPA: hypothetical protein ACP41M_001107 [Klebsiella aerogenes]
MKTNEHRIEVISASTPPFCPVMECAECELRPCPFEVRATRIAEAQAAYDEAAQNLEKAEDNLRWVTANA